MSVKFFLILTVNQLTPPPEVIALVTLVMLSKTVNQLTRAEKIKNDKNCKF